MKQEKALLQIEGRTLIERLALAFREAQVDSISLSVRREPNLLKESERLSLETLFDESSSIGPASALLAAHEVDPHATWVAVACDFPSANAACLRNLVEAHTSHKPEPEITCYGHEDGTPEPLLAIWTPTALSKLKANVALGLRGPIATLKKCDFLELGAGPEKWLINVNTPSEWAAANAANPYSTTNLSSPKTR